MALEVSTEILRRETRVRSNPNRLEFAPVDQPVDGGARDIERLADLTNREKGF
jgi:hypothetical protein